MTERVMVFIDAGYLHKSLAPILRAELRRRPDAEAAMAAMWDRSFAKFRESNWPLANTAQPVHGFFGRMKHAVHDEGLPLETAKAREYEAAELHLACDWFDHAKFAELLRGDRDLMRVIIYGASWPEDHRVPNYVRWRDEHLYDGIDWLPLFAVRLGDLAFRDGVDERGWTQKSVDVLLAVDLVRLAAKRAFDTAILVAADRDFVPAVETVLENGPRVEVVTVGEKQDWLPLARRADTWRHVGRDGLLGCLKVDLGDAERGAA